MKLSINIKNDFIAEYVSMAPLALAFERTMECHILSTQSFERPILDIGCGDGLFAKVLFKDKIDTGIDPNGHELERARDIDSYLELIECAGSAVPKPDGSYRTIFSNSVIEHIEDITPVLHEAYRLLSKGGRMYITVPTHCFDEYTWISQTLNFLRLHFLKKHFKSFFNHFWSHYHFYTPEKWKKIIEEFNFEVIEVREYSPRAICLLNDLLAPFGIFGYIQKKLINRWSLFPGFRRVLLAPQIFLGRMILKRSGRYHSHAGGLVFLSFQKPR